MARTSPPKPRRLKRERPDTLGKLSIQQSRALADELRAEMTHAEIRRKHGIPKSTWYRWHDPTQCPEYVGALEQGRGEAFAEASEAARSQVRRLLKMRESAFTVLEAMAGDDTLEPRDRIRAAAELARAVVSALLSSGFVPPSPPTGAVGGASNEVKAELEQILRAIQADGLRAVVESKPAQPADDEIDPERALARARARIEELERALAARG